MAIGVDNIEEIALSVKSPESESTLLGSEIEITILCAINALSTRLKLPFTMRFEQDMSYLDIAQKLGISIDNVYKRISQARAILQPQINKYLAGEDDSVFSEILLPSIKKGKPTKADGKQRDTTIQQYNDTTIQPELPPTSLTQLEIAGEALYYRGLECLYCQSIHISKNGHRRGKQNYLCHDPALPELFTRKSQKSLKALFCLIYNSLKLRNSL